MTSTLPRLLVTGANGLLGRHILYLTAGQQAWQVYATGRGADRREPDGYTYRAADLTDRAAVASLLAEVQPDVILHTAAMTRVDDCEDRPEEAMAANVEAVRYLSQAAPQAHLIHLSTDFVFDGQKGMYREEDQPRPLSHYGQTKMLSEEVALAHQSAAVVRTVLVYGTAPTPSRSNFVLWVVNSLRRGQSIQVVDDQWRTPTLVDDLADGCLRIARQQATGIFHLSGKDGLSPWQFAHLIAEVFELDSSLIEATNATRYQEKGQRPPKTGLDISKARQLLLYEPHSLREGLEILRRQLPKHL